MSSNSACPMCGAIAVTVVRERENVMVGQRSATIIVERMRCRRCSSAFYTPEQMDAAQRAASDQIRRQEGLLRGDEIRRIRERFEFTQRQFEQLLGVGPKTVVRWERGTVFQNRATDLLIRLVASSSDAARLLGEWNDVALSEAGIARAGAPTSSAGVPAPDSLYSDAAPLVAHTRPQFSHPRHGEEPRIIPIEPRLAKRQAANESQIPLGSASSPQPVDAAVDDLLDAYAK